jgi:hypothetical protein
LSLGKTRPPRATMAASTAGARRLAADAGGGRAGGGVQSDEEEEDEEGAAEPASSLAASFSSSSLAQEAHRSSYGPRRGGLGAWEGGERMREKAKNKRLGGCWFPLPPRRTRTAYRRPLQERGRNTHAHASYQKQNKKGTKNAPPASRPPARRPAPPRGRRPGREEGGPGSFQRWRAPSGAAKRGGRTPGGWRGGSGARWRRS